MKLRLPNFKRSTVLITISVLLGITILAIILCDKDCYASYYENMANMDEIIRQDKPAFVLFHKDTCPHCIAMMDEWGKLKEKYQGDPRINVVDLESKENANLMRRHNVRSFPTMIYMPHGFVSENYEGNDVFEGDRTEGAMSTYIEGRLANAGELVAPINGSRPPSRPSGYPIRALSPVADVMKLN